MAQNGYSSESLKVMRKCGINIYIYRTGSKREKKRKVKTMDKK